jgi:hypothetical protein
MEENYDLLAKVLAELQDHEVLSGLVLVGSWCQYYYRILFDHAPEVPLIRTMDVDFLVPNPARFKQKIDVTNLLNALGFDSDFDYSTGLVKYVHPNLEIQFLTPATGRAPDKPKEIKPLNINAEGLTYMKMLQDYKIPVTDKGLTVWVPEPAAFVLHKILISPKRKDPGKKEKDLMTAQSIGELCLDYDHHRHRLNEIFTALPKKWQRTILVILKPLSPGMFSFLTASMQLNPAKSKKSSRPM